MSNSISEFFSKSGIKKFKNGAKSIADKTAVKVVAASMVLAGAFGTTRASSAGERVELNNPGPVTAFAVTERGDTLCSYLAEKTDSASFARLQNLVNTATKSKTGREVLKCISDQNTVLTMGDAGRGTIGYFTPDGNMICLNEMFDDATLQSCLVHEGKHSVQSFSLGRSLEYTNTFLTNTVISRVMEADAVATQTKFSYEMAQRGDSAAWKSLREEHKGITETFEKNAKKHGVDKKKTMRETMLAWYKDKEYAGLYDQSMIQFHRNITLNATKDQIQDSFKDGIDTDVLIRSVCKLGGKTYATDGKMLMMPETAYLSRSDQFSLEALNVFLKQRTGREDVSSKFMYPVERDGSVSKKTFLQEDQAERLAEKNKRNTAKTQTIVNKMNTRTR